MNIQCLIHRYKTLQMDIFSLFHRYQTFGLIFCVCFIDTKLYRWIICLCPQTKNFLQMEIFKFHRQKTLQMDIYCLIHRNKTQTHRYFEIAQNKDFIYTQIFLVYFIDIKHFRLIFCVCFIDKKNYRWIFCVCSQAQNFID